MSDQVDDEGSPLDLIADAFESADAFNGFDLASDADGAAPVKARSVYKSRVKPSRVAKKRKRHTLDDIGDVDIGRFPYARLRHAACAGLDESDTDNAKRFLIHRGKDVLVRIQEGGQKPIWVTWTGTHWDDVTGAHAASAIAQTLGEQIKLEAQVLTHSSAELAAIDAGKLAYEVDPENRSPEERVAIKRAVEAIEGLQDRRAKRVKFGISCKNKTRITSMLDCLVPHVLIAPEAFNADPRKLATPTQTLTWVQELDLECPDPSITRYKARVNVWEGHSKRDYITLVMPWSYDPNAKCPLWLAFMARFMPDPEVRRFCQIAFGLGLLGLTEQAFVFHYGDGANGKSVVLEVISRVLGPLAASLPAEALSGDDDSGLKASPEIARLFCKRFVRISEIKAGVKLQEEFVKRITGSEKFPARNLFEGYFEFEPIFIPHGSGNGYPQINGTDNGIWRRMRVVKWPIVLADEEQRQFADVVGELVAEAPGIFAWLVEGARLYLEEGLVSPAAVKAETKAFRNEMDVVGRFASKCLVITENEDDIIYGKPLYDNFVAWAEGNNVKVISGTMFGKNIGKVKGIVKDDTGKLVTYHFIKFKEAPRNPSSDGWPTDDPRTH